VIFYCSKISTIQNGDTAARHHTPSSIVSRLRIFVRHWFCLSPLPLLRLPGRSLLCSDTEEKFDFPPKILGIPNSNTATDHVSGPPADGVRPVHGVGRSRCSSSSQDTHIADTRKLPTHFVLTNYDMIYPYDDTY